MVGALGLPPVAGSNPAARACLAALRMVAVLDRLSICCYVGISMGQVRVTFCMHVYILELKLTVCDACAVLHTALHLAAAVS
jgi:hypothetical protein